MDSVTNLYSDDDHRIPDGWTIIVYEDGKALPCSPRCSERELGGYWAALPCVEDAIQYITEMLGEGY